MVSRPGTDLTDLVLLATVSAVRPLGGYDALSLSVPSSPAWERARPGQLVVVPGEPARGEVLPHVHWLAGVSVDLLHGTTIELVLPVATGASDHDLGAHLLGSLPVGQDVRLFGPLGRGFPLPAQPVPVLLVAHEVSAAPLRWLVALLRERGCPVHVLLSAADPDLHLDPGALRRQADSVVLAAPDDFSAALVARLDDPATDPALVLATGPRDLVRVVASLAAPRGRVVRVAALDPASPLVCGTGVCGSCDLVVDEPDGPRRVRPCLEGPVVPGEWLLAARSAGRRALGRPEVPLAPR